MKSRILVFATIWFAFASAGAAPAARHVIVHPESGVSQLSPADMESIYLGKKTLWESGKKIMPVLLNEDNPTTKAFIETVLNKTIDQYRSYWKRRLFSGGGAVPRSFSSSSELIDFVAKTPGAIGVVDVAPKDDRVKLIELAK